MARTLTCAGSAAGRPSGFEKCFMRHEDRHVGERAEHAARQHDLLAADPVGEPAEVHEQRRA